MKFALLAVALLALFVAAPALGSVTTQNGPVQSVVAGDSGGGKPRIGSLCSAPGFTSWCIYKDGRTGPCICIIQVICGIDTYIWMPL